MSNKKPTVDPERKAHVLLKQLVRFTEEFEALKFGDKKTRDLFCDYIQEFECIFQKFHETIELFSKDEKSREARLHKERKDREAFQERWRELKKSEQSVAPCEVEPTP